ncbi:MAG: 2-nitropropane dioxygenase [Frankiales bacterium]|nr:2-nitropropane dioxygenase [Frankiales bacterium]
MGSLLTELGISNRVFAAPMAGGPTTTDLVIAAGRAGSLGFLAAGYKAPELVAEQLAAVRGAGFAFGVNLFAPNPVPISRDAFNAYARALQPEADVYGIDLSEIGLRQDEDHWTEKIDLLLADPVPIVSFTFGIPAEGVIAALKRVGTITVQTVTSAAEARQAAAAGVDLLAVQSSAAGGHSGTFTPQSPPQTASLPELIRQIKADVSTPLIGAGGVGDATDVAAVMAAGAEAVLVGTVLLRAAESGASAAHRDALSDPDFNQTIVTRAFTGRPARALRNHFTTRYADVAPAGYPAIHHLTSPIRQAAAAAHDDQRINLWAGTGYRQARAEPVARILDRLAGQL